MDQQRPVGMIAILAMLDGIVRRLERVEAYVWDTEPKILEEVPDRQPKAEDLNLTQ